MNDTSPKRPSAYRNPQHPGNPWEAAQALIWLEAGSMTLADTHTRLFAELNFSEGEFDRLEALIRTPEDAARVCGHPNCSDERRARLIP